MPKANTRIALRPEPVKKANSVKVEPVIKKGNRTINFYKAGCKLLYRKRIQIVGKNYIEKRVGNGPVLILSTHHERIEPALIQSLTDGHVQWISGFVSSSKRLIFKVPGVKRMVNNLNNIDIDKDNLTPQHKRTILNSGINVLENEGTLGVFPVGHVDPKDVANDPKGVGHSSAIYIAREAEKKLGVKIPVILVSIAKDKKTGRYYMFQKETTLPENLDRKILIAEYMRQMENARNILIRNFRNIKKS